MAKGNCGKLAGQMGITLDLNGRKTKRLKQFEKTEAPKTEEPATEEEITVEVSEPQPVAEPVPEAPAEEDTGDGDDSGDLPEGVRRRPDGRHEIQCPGGCNEWLCIEDQPPECPKCGGELIWN